jgi:hypothetical protein
LRSSLIGEKSREFLRRLVHAEQLDDAFVMLRGLIAVGVHDAEERFAPEAPMEEWLHEEVLREDVPLLIDTARERVLWLLCEVLAEAIPNSEGNGPISLQSFSLRSDRYQRVVAVTWATARRIAEDYPARVRTLAARLEQVHDGLLAHLGLSVLATAPQTAMRFAGDRLLEPRYARALHTPGEYVE